MRRFWIKNKAMDEKRRAKRLKEENEINATIVSGGGNHPKERVIYNHGKDISVSGAKIQANVFLPVDTLLEMDILLKDLSHKITAFGKVKWSKMMADHESYETGLEFVSSPPEAIPALADYISLKLKAQKS